MKPYIAEVARVGSRMVPMVAAFVAAASVYAAAAERTEVLECQAAKVDNKLFNAGQAVVANTQHEEDRARLLMRTENGIAVFAVGSLAVYPHIINTLTYRRRRSRRTSGPAPSPQPKIL